VMCGKNEEARCTSMTARLLGNKHLAVIMMFNAAEFKHKLGHESFEEFCCVESALEHNGRGLWHSIVHGYYVNLLHTFFAFLGMTSFTVYPRACRRGLACVIFEQLRTQPCVFLFHVIDTGSTGSRGRVWGLPTANHVDVVYVYVYVTMRLPSG